MVGRGEEELFWLFMGVLPPTLFSPLLSPSAAGLKKSSSYDALPCTSRNDLAQHSRQNENSTFLSSFSFFSRILSRQQEGLQVWWLLYCGQHHVGRREREIT